MAKGLKGINTKEGALQELNRMGYANIPTLKPSYASYRRVTNLATPAKLYIGLNLPEDYGESVYDDAVTSYSELYNLNDVRALELSWFTLAINGILKGTLIAGTTFLDGTIGLITGLLLMIVNAVDGNKDTKWYNGIWDNAMTLVSYVANLEAEKLLPNYRSSYSLESPWYSWDNMTSANFIFDTIIKNMGFTVGAAYSGSVYTKVIDWAAKAIGASKLGKALTTVVKTGEKAMLEAKKTKATKAVVGSFFNAHAEAVWEAYNSSLDFIRILGEKINNKAYELELKALEDFVNNGGVLNLDGTIDLLNSDLTALTIYNLKLSNILKAKELASLEAIRLSKNVGTMDGLLNIPVLFISDLFMFGKMYAGGWLASRNAHKTITKASKAARKEAKALAKKGDPSKLEELDNIVLKAKLTGYLGLTDAEKNLVEEVYPHILGKFTGSVSAAVKGPFREANEEMLLGAASLASVYRYESGVDKIFNALLDLPAMLQTRDLISSLSYGLMNLYGDINKYEEAFVGAITGLLGVPTFGRSNNSSDLTLGRGKMVGLTGGSFIEVRDFLRKRRELDKAALTATLVIKDPRLADNIKHLIALTKFSEDGKRAIIHDDEKEYKDSRTASTFEMILNLRRVNRLDLLTNAMKTTTNFTDEEIALFAEDTTKLVSPSDPEVQHKILAKKALEEETRLKQELLDLLKSITTFTSRLHLISVLDRMAKLNIEIEYNKRAIYEFELEIKAATPVVVSPFIHEDGSAFTVDEIKLDLKKRVDHFQTILDTILNAETEIDNATSEVLSNELLSTLTWYRVMMDDWLSRANKMTDKIKDLLQLVTEKLEFLDAIKAIKDIDSLLEETGLKPSEASIQLGGKFTILLEIKSYSNIINHILLALSLGGLNLAYLLSSKDLIRITEDLKMELGDLIKNLISVVLNSQKELTQDTKDSFMKIIGDLKSIGEGHRKYNDLLAEFLSNPEGIDLAHQNSVNRANRLWTRANINRINSNIDWNSSTALIARLLEENKALIELSGGFVKFLLSLTPELREKAKLAEAFRRGVDSISDIIDELDLDDELKSLLKLFTLGFLDDADSLEEAIEAALSALNDGVLEEEILNSIPEDLDPDITEALILAMELAFSNILDEISDLVVLSIEEALKAIDAEFEELADLALAFTDLDLDIEDTVPEDEDIDDSPVSLEGEISGELEDDIKAGINPETSSSVKTNNKKLANRTRPLKGESGYNRRRLISLYYLHGVDKESLPDHYDLHPEDIPEGVDKEAFKRYIRAVHKKLVESGAYTYISGVNPNLKLKKGLEIRFITDPLLNQDAGVPVILMVVTNELGKDLIIGSLPTKLDFDSKIIGSNKTRGEVNPEDKALYEELCNELLNSDELKLLVVSMPSGTIVKLGLPSSTGFKSNSVSEEDARFESTTDNGVTYFLPIVSPNYTGIIKSVDAYDNAVEFIGGAKSEATEFIVVEPGEAIIENGKLKITKKAKVFAVTPSTPFSTLTAQQSTLLSTPEVSRITTKVEALRGGRPSFSSLNRPISEIFDEALIPILVFGKLINRLSNSVLDSALPVIDPLSGLVYVYVTANTGVLIPILCYSTELRSLDKNDWYIQLIVDVILALSTGANIGSDKIRLLKLIPSIGDNLHVNLVERNNRKFLTIDYGRDADNKTIYHYTLPLAGDDHISVNNIYSFIDTISNRKLDNDIYPTTSIDRTKLNDTEYMKNISRYLFTDLTPNSPRTIDDWFTYEATEILKRPRGRTPRTNPVVAPELHIESPILTSESDLLDSSILDNKLELTQNDNLSPNLLDNLPSSEDTNLNKRNSFMPDYNLDLKLPDGLRLRRRRRPSGKPLLVSEITEELTLSEDLLLKELKRISKMFPTLARQGRIVLVNGLINIVDNNGNPLLAYGLFRNGILYISTQCPKGTAYHEAFHYITETLLSSIEKSTMFEEATKLFGNLPLIELEEILAEKFREFMNLRLDYSIKGRLKNIFLKLKHIVQSLFNKESYLDNLFWSIYRNKMQNRKESIQEDTFKLELLRYKSEKLKYSNLSTELKESFRDRGLSPESYDNLSIEAKETVLRCM